MHIALHYSNSTSKSIENSITFLSPIVQYCLGTSELNLDPDPAEGNIATNGLIKFI